MDVSCLSDECGRLTDDMFSIDEGLEATDDSALFEREDVLRLDRRVQVIAVLL